MILELYDYFQRQSGEIFVLAKEFSLSMPQSLILNSIIYVWIVRTVRVNLSDPSFSDGIAEFTTAPF